MSAPRVSDVFIKNYKSIGSETLRVRLPSDGPLVVLGENNAGKSNIAKAIELILGERWAGSVQLDDHDFYGRDPDGIEVQIAVNVSGIECPKCHQGEVKRIHWRYDEQGEEGPVKYSRSCTSCQSTFMSNEIKGQLGCILIGADRRLHYQLSYTSKYTFLARLMTSFHDAMKSNATVEATLKELFANIRTEFDKVTEFKEFQKLLIETVDSFGGNLRYALDIDFSAYDPSNYFRSLRVHPMLNNEARNFDELGTGQEQVLALAFAYSYAKAFGKQSGLLLVIDEPESHLHPLAQRWLAEQINELCSQDGLQVMVTTHSPLFIDLTKPANLLVVRRDSEDDPTKVVQLTTDELAENLRQRKAAVTDSKAIGPFYAASATPEILSGFFARCCVLVEGPTEALALPPLLRHLQLDVLREGVAVIPCGGLPGIARWVRLFEAYGIPTFAILDSDGGLSPKKRADEAAARNDLEAVLRVSGTNDYAAPVTVAEGCAVMGNNFEEAMVRTLGDSWSNAYAEAQAIIGSGRQLKPLCARHAATRLDVASFATPEAGVLAELAAAISARFQSGTKAEVAKTAGAGAAC